MDDRQPMLNDVRVAIAFLTRIPISHGSRIDMGRIARWFPTVGLLIGGAAAGLLAASRPLFGDRMAAALAVLFGVLMTGGFHHDGLADSADGLVGGWTPEQRRAILKDSRHGTYGVLALVLQIVLQVTALGDMPTSAAVACVVLMHSVGRASAVSVMKSGHGVAEGLGANYVAGVSRGDQSVALISALLFAVAVAGPLAPVTLVAGILIAQLVARYAIRRIGGIVGDVLGAAEQIGETTVLLTALVCVHITGEFGW
jgi:adenosylcobinamide-GDP ribazoletransferase